MFPLPDIKEIVVLAGEGVYMAYRLADTYQTNKKHAREFKNVLDEIIRQINHTRFIRIDKRKDTGQTQPWLLAHIMMIEQDTWKVINQANKDILRRIDSAFAISKARDDKGPIIKTLCMPSTVIKILKLGEMVDDFKQVLSTQQKKLNRLNNTIFETRIDAGPGDVQPSTPTNAAFMSPTASVEALGIVVAVEGACVTLEAVKLSR